MSSVYGRRGLQSVVALTQAPLGGMTLGEVGAAIAAPLTSAQRAVATLVRDGLVLEEGAERERRFSLDRNHPASGGLVEFALRMLEPREALDILFRANQGVLYAGRNGEGYVAVLSTFAEPPEVATLASAVETVTGGRARAPSVQLMERWQLTEELLNDSTFRQRGQHLEAVKGSAERVFRDPRNHGSEDAPRLGRLHPTLPTPSRQFLARLAREHGLRRIAFFGSSVRSDFRPESDVDVMVEPKLGRRLGLRELREIRREFENRLGRDVDVVTAGSLRPDFLSRVEEEGVVLYGRS